MVISLFFSYVIANPFKVSGPIVHNCSNAVEELQITIAAHISGCTSDQIYLMLMVRAFRILCPSLIYGTVIGSSRCVFSISFLPFNFNLTSN
jgi:hypothetical protein